MKENQNMHHKREVLPSQAFQQEDAALKTMMQFFADELLPLLGIKGKVARISPTEQVDITIHKQFEDFNFEMEDRTWKHFEFQSSDKGIMDLKRFRAYEATISHYFKVEVTTYVLYSGTIKNPVTEFTEGVNTYRVVPIIMNHRDAGMFIKELEEKKKRGEPLTRSDLVWLTLCPLMGGDMPQKERLSTAYRITKEGSSVLTDTELEKIEAVIYAMADKFLDSIDMDEFREGMKMTKLGQMLVNDGKAEGKAELIGIIRRKLSEGLTPEAIADWMEIDRSYVREIARISKEDPGIEDFRIARELMAQTL